MVAEEMEEYALASAEAAYEDPGEQTPLEFMASGEVFHDGNVSHWLDQKHPSFPSQAFLENTNCETSAIHMSVEEFLLIKATGRVNASLE